MPRLFVAIASPLHRTLALCALVALAPLTLRAQIGNAPPSIPDGGPNFSPGRPDEDPLREHPELRERMERSRAADRQRRIVDDANRLVALTAQYRRSVADHGTPTGEDGKLLVQIEKLARDLKDRMRGM